MTDLTELEIPAATPGLYLTTLAHDFLLAEKASQRDEHAPPYWNRSTLAYVYGQASRMFNDNPVRIGASHLEHVANAVERTDACPFCLNTGRHYSECLQPF